MTRTYAARGWVYCSGSGTSRKVATVKPPTDGRPLCIVMIRDSKPSGLCSFCERTER